MREERMVSLSESLSFTVSQCVSLIVSVLTTPVSLQLLLLSSTSISAVQLLRSQIFKESIAAYQTRGGESEEY